MGQLIIELLSENELKVLERFVLDSDGATIGRSYNNDIILNDPFVSPDHLLISSTDDKLHIKDLASDNGTVVNGGHRLNDDSAELASGTKISLGKSKLKLILPNHPVEPTKRFDAFHWLDRFENLSVTLLFTFFTFGVFVYLNNLLGSGKEFWGALVLGNGGEYLLIVSINLLLLCLICRFTIHKYFFKRNLALINASLIIDYSFMVLAPFLFVLFTDYDSQVFTSSTLDFLYDILFFWIFFKVCGIALNNKTKAIIVGSFFIIHFFSALMTSDSFLQRTFSSDPQFNAELAPYVRPTSRVEPLGQFLDSTAQETFDTPE